MSPWAIALRSLRKYNFRGGHGNPAAFRQPVEGESAANFTNSAIER